MTIKEMIACLENPGTLRTDAERQLLKSVIAVLSPVSMETVIDFQRNWDSNKSFLEFINAQDKVFLTCLQLEISETGAIVREALQLAPLTEETLLHL